MEHQHISVGSDIFQVTSPPVPGPDGDAKLHVIVSISNYVQYKRRYELFWKFKKHIESHHNVILHVVEIAFGDRPFMVTKEDNKNDLQLRTRDELWHKENSINLMVGRLPSDWKYVAWVDGDIKFLNPNVIEDTIHQLQHYGVVQMFQTVVNLGPNGESISTYQGFMSQYLKGKKFANKTGYYGGSYGEFWHPGFAWAATREAWNAIGGLIDFAILGAGDHHMALAMIGMADKSIPGNVSDPYSKRVLQYQATCEKHLRRNVGYVNGMIIHHFHGSFKNRKYAERWNIITGNKFDPDVDIKRDWSGLMVFNSPEKIGLRDEIRQYFRARNEDSIDV